MVNISTQLLKLECHEMEAVMEGVPTNHSALTDQAENSMIYRRWDECQIAELVQFK